MDPTSQATCRQEKMVKVLEWGTGPGATTLTFAILGSRGRAPYLHTIFKDWADDRVNNSQFGSDTQTRRHKHTSPRVVNSQPLPICSGNMRVPAPGRWQPDAKYRTWSTTVRDEVPQWKPNCRAAATTSGGPTRRMLVLSVFARQPQVSPYRFMASKVH
jgi:hypothetical protein